MLEMLYRTIKYLRTLEYEPDRGLLASKHEGTIEIKNGRADLPFLIYGQYFIVEGSIMNDGCYQYGIDDEMNDEVFDGVIYGLRLTPTFKGIIDEMTAYQEQHKEVSPYQSESFGGYSYTLKASQTGTGTASVIDLFADRLNFYKKV